MDKEKKKPVLNLTLTAMFMAIGLVLPFLTGQIQQFFGSATVGFLWRNSILTLTRYRNAVIWY